VTVLLIISDNLYEDWFAGQMVIVKSHHVLQGKRHSGYTVALAAPFNTHIGFHSAFITPIFFKGMTLRQLNGEYTFLLAPVYRSGKRPSTPVSSTTCPQKIGLKILSVPGSTEQ
jgi:hypothetical protein